MLSPFTSEKWNNCLNNMLACQLPTWAWMYIVYQPVLLLINNDSKELHPLHVRIQSCHKSIPIMDWLPPVSSWIVIIVADNAPPDIIARQSRKNSWRWWGRSALVLSCKFCRKNLSIITIIINIILFIPIMHSFTPWSICSCTIIFMPNKTIFKCFGHTWFLRK